MKIEFGAYKGESVESLPMYYLLWLASQKFVAAKYRALFDAVMEEIEIRFEQGRARLELLREQLGTGEV